MKQNQKGSSINVRSVKQETKEIKESVIKIENHIRYFNMGMRTFTDFVKVMSNFAKTSIDYN